MTILTDVDTNGIVNQYDLDIRGDILDGFSHRIIHDVTTELEFNKKDQNDGHNGFGATRDMRRIASIPLSLIEIWKHQYGIDVLTPEGTPFLLKMLRDPDHKWLRTADGRI